MKVRSSMALSLSALVLAIFGGNFRCLANDLGCRSLRFLKPVDEFALEGHVIQDVYLHMGTEPSGECRSLCGMESTCVSVNIGPQDENGDRLCQLSNSDHTQHPKDLKRREGFLYWATMNPCSSNACLHNATCLNGFTEKRYICLCHAGYTGEHCEKAFNALFTNLNASGRYGPKSLGSHYTGQDHDGQVTLSSSIQQWTVPRSGDYRIEAIGAAGGYDTLNDSSQYRGRGARIIGTFILFKSEVIQILVGQEGGINKDFWSSAGGGGTFVVRGSNTPLLIAGGGGGVQGALSRHPGCDASTNTTGNPGYKSWSGGSNGHGAQTADEGYSGGGGGGFHSSGRSGKNFNGTMGYGGEGGNGFLQGGVGGRAREKNIVGGFGGGAGAYGWGGGGGGGGGYSGGSSGSNASDSCGGGGGSFNAGKNQDNECCYNSAGHGQVTITLL